MLLDPVTGLMVKAPKATTKPERKVPKTPVKVPSTFEHGTRATKDSERLRHSRIHSGVSNFADLDRFDSELDDSRDRPISVASDESEMEESGDEYKPIKKELSSLSSSSEDEDPAPAKKIVKKGAYWIFANLFNRHLLVSVHAMHIY